MLEGRSQLASQPRVVPEKVGTGWDETVLKGILTSNFATSPPGRLGAWTTPFGDAGRGEAYSFVLGCTDDS